MKPREILLGLKTGLSLDDAQVAEIISIGGQELSVDRCSRLTVRGADACSGPMLGIFLEGLVEKHRGPPSQPRKPSKSPTNNDVLKKVRAALQLHESDVVEILAAGGHTLNKRHVGSFFRKQGNKNFRPCSDGLARAFFEGLALRGPAASA